MMRPFFRKVCVFSSAVALVALPFSSLHAAGNVLVAKSVPQKYSSDVSKAQAILRNMLQDDVEIVEVFPGPSGFLGYVVVSGDNRMILWQTPARDMIVSGAMFDEKGRNLSQLASEAYQSKTPMDIVLAQYESSVKKELEDFFARIRLAIDALPADSKEAFYRAYSEILKNDGIVQQPDGDRNQVSAGALSPEMSVAQGCGTDRRQASADSTMVPSVFVPVSPLLAEGFRSRLAQLEKDVGPIVLGDKKASVRVHVFADANCPYSRKLVEAIVGSNQSVIHTKYLVYPVAVFSKVEDAARILAKRDVAPLMNKSATSQPEKSEAEKGKIASVEAATAFLRKYVGYDATPFVVLEKNGKFWLMVGPRAELLFSMIEDTTGKIDLYAQIR